MKWNTTLMWFTFGFIVINSLFYLHLSSMNGGSSMIYVFIFPIFWLLTIFVVGFWSYKQRYILFEKDIRTSSFILLFFCTPIPIFLLGALLRPEMYRASTGFITKNGTTIKSEEWVYNNGKLAIRKYWKINIANYNGNGDDDSFKKDSTWIYLEKNGDTLKTETYKDNQLIITTKKH
jgi:hypothetical protein